MIRYECNECGELIDDEDNMKWVDVMTQYCPQCFQEMQNEENNEQIDEVNKEVKK